MAGNYAEAETYSAFIIDHASEINAKYTSITDLTSETGLFYSNASVKGSRILGFNFAHNDNEATQSGHLEQLTLAYPLVQNPILKYTFQRTAYFRFLPISMTCGLESWTPSNIHPIMFRI